MVTAPVGETDATGEPSHSTMSGMPRSIDTRGATSNAAALENEGLTTSDAQAVADVEIDRGTFPRNGGPEEVRDA